MNPKIQNNLFLIIERLWLLSAISGIALTLYLLIRKDYEGAFFFTGFFVLSGSLFTLRKSQRKKQEAFLKEKDEKRKS